MKIRRLYYEESKMSDRIIEEKVKAKMCKMSEEEQIRDKKQKLMEAQVIVEMAKMKIDAKLNNISQERVKHFEKMAMKKVKYRIIHIYLLVCIKYICCSLLLS